MEAKRTEVVNLIHAGFTRVCLQVIRISGVPKTTFYKVKKRDSAKRVQMPSPVNKSSLKSLKGMLKTEKLFNIV